MSSDSKTNNGNKNNVSYVPIAEEMILRSIEESTLGSPCVHGAGPSCSIETVTFDRKVLPHEFLGLDKDTILKALKNMISSRITDEKHLSLLKQGKSFFHIGVSGHEAIQTAVGMTLQHGLDWGWPYYRDMAYMYAIGLTPKDYFLLALAKQEDPSSGGRQMPNHYGHRNLNQPAQTSSTGTQYLNAVGTALAAKKMGERSITYVSSGEGATSQGEFYEAVNWASREKLPVLFCIEDNGYAISVPREHQGMGNTVGHSFCCYSNLKMKTFDGTDFFQSLMAARQAVDYIRSGKGPALLHAKVVRLLAHSSSDDQRKYRSKEELEEENKKQDCIHILTEYILENRIATHHEIDTLKKQVKEEINEAAEWALSRPEPTGSEAVDHVFAPVETRDLAYTLKEPEEGHKIVMVDAINHAMHEEMEFNDRMLIFGEDVADPKGGVFTATKGLSTKFGGERVFNSPLAEASIIGVAIGLGVRGFKPVVEIQFGDYIWPAFQQIRNEVSTMRYRSNGDFSCPMVIRVAVGGYIHGGLCHSQNIEAYFAHIPGLLIAYPSSAADAKGLLKTACRLKDPVIFLEHKGMYRLPFAMSLEPGADYLLPFGKGKIVKEGSDATIITYGMGVRDSVNAANTILKETGRSVEVIDLRTIIPWDKELVLDSVKKTGRALIVHEDLMTMGFGAEIAAYVSNETFRFLDAPVARVAAKDSHIPYSPVFEEEVLPNEKKVTEQLRNLLNF